MFNSYDIRTSDPGYFKQFSVKDLLVVYYECPQVDKHVNLFTHYNEIVYTISGKKILHHGGKSWVLTDNLSLFIRRTAYQQELAHTVGWKVLAFNFQDEFLKQAFKEYRQYLAVGKMPDPPQDMLVQIHVNDTAKAFFKSIIPYFSQRVPPAENLLELKFKELLFIVFSDPANAALVAYVNSILDQHKTPIREIMEANFTFNLTIPEFARIAQRSVTSFKREFEHFYKMTPGKWLTKKRLEYAQMLLKTSQKNITEIAYESGFENATHFGRIFKERFKLSPLKYRTEKNSNPGLLNQKEKKLDV